MSSILSGLDVPDGGLVATTLPMPGPPVAHDIPAGLVLPVIITATDHQTGLIPDDLTPKHKMVRRKTFRHDVNLKARMPGIGDIAGKERPGFAPVSMTVVHYLANSDCPQYVAGCCHKWSNKRPPHRSGL